MKRYGSQTPTFFKLGDFAYSIGDEVADMFEEDAHKKYYDCQRSELKAILARNEDGSPAAQVICISKPRQNGKSFSARDAVTYMGDFEYKRCLYSAHNGSTTRKMAKEIFALFENKERYPEFAKDVKEISRARGYEGIYFNDYIDEDGEWHQGGCIEFSTRTNSGARGGTYSVVIIDEAQELTTDQQDALIPTMSAASEADKTEELPLQIYLGTPPGPTCRGTVFRNMRNSVKSGKSKGIWWIEWSLESNDLERDIPDAETALRLAYQTNPAMGYRISEKTVLSEYETMTLDGFARERLNWWSPVHDQEETAIKKDKWSMCCSDEQKPNGKTAYGVKFSQDGTEVVLCGAVCPDNNKARVSLIERKSTSHGIQWLADWLNKRYMSASCVVIDGKNNVDLLIEKISGTWKAKDSIIRATSKTVVSSTSQIVNEINENTLTWYRLQEDLDDSAKTSTKRMFSGGWGFGGTNPLPIEASALALWGCRTSKRNPNKKQRIG